MRRLNLAPYTITVQQPSATVPGTTENVEKPYAVRESIVNVLFAGGHEGRALLKCDAVAQKIEAADEGSVLLEDAEFKLIETAFDAWKRFGRNEVELVRRVQDAERVNLRDVKVDPPEDPPATV